jgi:Reversibly glycosylated polypeptide
MHTRPSCSLVLTTIHSADVLTSYYENSARYGHLDQIEAIVIADRKTPGAVSSACEQINGRGLRTRFWSVDAQDAYLRSLGVPTGFIPYDSDNRRNIGYLLALYDHKDFLISIDDDNFCSPDWDVFAEHAVVCGDPLEVETIHSSTRWINICDMLQIEPAVRVYPRGFPYRWRHKAEQLQSANQRGRVAINAGLWLSEPDLDGITWLATPVRAPLLKTPSLVLGGDTWSPINSQNTALCREAIPAYYFLKMGYQVGGLAIDRYGDIFSGYFALACARHLGHLVRFGTPAAIHRRNSHQYLKDATSELACIWMLEDLLEWLVDAKLEGSSYLDAYRSLSYLIEDAVEGFRGFIWTDSTRGYIHQMGYHMRLWAKYCDR